MSYVDGYLVAVPRKHLDVYKKMARLCAKVWVDHGALEYSESFGDELKPKGFTLTLPKVMNLKRGEVVVFGWIVYRSKRQRDSVNKKVMADPRVQKMMKQKQPFKLERMAYGGFKPFVSRSNPEN